MGLGSRLPSTEHSLLLYCCPPTGGLHQTVQPCRLGLLACPLDLIADSIGVTGLNSKHGLKQAQ